MPTAPPPAAQERQNTSTGVRTAKRKYTSKACEECRRRRAKCDGKRPSCSRCTDRGIECRFRFEEDGRRPAPKSYVQLLRKRIELLERVLESNGIDVDDAVARVIEEDKASSESGPAASSQRRDIEGGTSSSRFEELCAAFEGALSLDESLNFDQDGEMRYFGPTSGRLEFQSSGCSTTESSPEARLDGTPESIQSRIQSDRFLQINKGQVKVPDELKAELIDLYFIWEQPWYQVVNEELFRESERCNGRYSSPLLLNCVLALGSRFSDRPELRSDPDDPNTAGKLFFEKAEALLRYDLKWPSITTIQSLCLLAMMYFATGSDAAGWLHQGMANRLALDMGLNLDAKSLAGSDLIPVEEADLRRQIYWALYCHDKLAAIYSGRVCTMLDHQGAVDISSKSKPHQTALITLCCILEKIILTLYAPKPLVNQQQKISFLSSCVLELRTWFYDLPPELRIDRPSKTDIPPQAYTMHMVYHTSFILLMKPFLAKFRERPTGEEDDAVTKKATVICHEASRQMVLVARKYQQVYRSFRKSPITATHCTPSASIVLLQLAKQKQEGTKSKEARMIQSCLQVLEELSTAWDIAKRIRQSLFKLYQQLGSATDERSSSTYASENNQATSPNSRNPDDNPAQAASTFKVPDESLMQNFPEELTPGLNIETDVEGFAEEMLLDDSLWTGTNLGFAFESLPSDYNSFEVLNRWRFNEGW